MCHQVIEKILKAYWSSVTEEQLDFIDVLEPLNIEARYPSNKERLMKSLNADRCNELIKLTDELRIWIKSKL